MDKGNITICLCASRSIIDKESIVEVSQILNEAGYTITIEADFVTNREGLKPRFPKRLRPCPNSSPALKTGYY
ncbi:hypothetical protein EZS27_038423, partial [termite gut metagenome]